MNRELLIKAIEDVCPLSMAESWDNCGYQINSGKEFVTRVLVALEVTEEVIDEAEKIDADLILTHHPLIFGGISSVNHNEVTGNYLLRLIKVGIDVYSCHTNFDKVTDGNNDYLGKVLEMSEVRGFDGESAEGGFCRKGVLTKEMTLSEFADFTAEKLGIERNQLRFVGDGKKVIKTAGWCTGAGAEFIGDATKEGCDVYITGDVKYHEAQAASEKGICVIDAGHYGTEQIFAENMAALIREKLESAEGFDGQMMIFASKVKINPFN